MWRTGPRKGLNERIWLLDRVERTLNGRSGVGFCTLGGLEPEKNKSSMKVLQEIVVSNQEFPVVQFTLKKIQRTFFLRQCVDAQEFYLKSSDAICQWEEEGHALWQKLESSLTLKATWS